MFGTNSGTRCLPNSSITFFVKLRPHVFVKLRLHVFAKLRLRIFAKLRHHIFAKFGDRFFAKQAPHIAKLGHPFGWLKFQTQCLYSTTNPFNKPLLTSQEPYKI